MDYTRVVNGVLEVKPKILVTTHLCVELPF